jgi:XTP/dITP diphosphohydrolase
VRRLYMVTHNDRKFLEASLILKPYGIELQQIKAEKLEVQDEDVVRIAEVAARHAYEQFRVPLIVDDSGLYIEALNGFPGPYSSFFLEKVGLSGVLKLLSGVTNRRACFRTGLAYADEEGVRTFVGEVCGSIAESPRGSGGFGYDPLFVPEGHSRTFAEMSVEEKDSMSHRGRALRAFAEWYLKRP